MTSHIRTFSSLEPFWITNLLPVLRIGDAEFQVSGYAGHDSDGQIVFRVPREDYDRIVAETPNADVTVVYGVNAGHERWTFGPVADFLR